MSAIAQVSIFRSCSLSNWSDTQQATIRHEDLALALSECFEQLCEDIAHWKKRVLKHLTVRLVQEKVRELYTIVFQFVTDIFTEWYASSWKRFKKSFDKNAASKLFQPHKDKLERLSSQLDGLIRDHEHEVIQKDVAELTRITTEKTSEVLHMLGLVLNVQLEEHQRTVHDESSISKRLLVSSGHANEHGDSKIATRPFEQQEMLSRIPNLASHTQRPEEFQRLLERASQLQIDKRTTEVLQRWISVQEPTNQWIEGPPQVAVPSQNTLTSVAVTALLQQRHCVVSYFRHPDSTQNKRQALRSLVRSLIVQLAGFLPPRVFTAVDMSSQRFELAMETDGEIVKSLSLFSDLQKLVSRAVIYVIDGLQALEDRSDRDHTRNLYDFTSLMCNGILNPHAPSKLCFFTDGYVDALARAVEAGTLKSSRFELESDERLADDVEPLDTAERMI